MQKKKRHSPFSVEFWVAKGYTPEAADYKRNSMRPIKPEYWLEKGHSKDEAEIKAKETKRSNDIKAVASSKEIPYEKRMYNNTINPEYWVRKGYSIEEAKKLVSDRQNTFSIEKCIKKYGPEEGTKRWLDRQVRWQNTLNTKSEDEKRKINKNKSTIKVDHYNSIEHCIESLYKSRNMVLSATFDGFLDIIAKKMMKNPNTKYQHPLYYIHKEVPKVQLQILQLTEEEAVDKISHLFMHQKYLLKRGNKQAYRLNTDIGLLRSSYEIYFYEKFIELFPDELIILDKPYPNSNFRFDFYVLGCYIEICPLYGIDPTYTEKMDLKQQLFDCIHLKDIESIDCFLKDKRDAINGR